MTERERRIDDYADETPNEGSGVEVALPISGPRLSGLKDHFTLPIRSSTVRYRDNKSTARVIEGDGVQYVLEETVDANSKEQKIELRRIKDTTSGVQLLRLAYALVTAFWTGFLFVFCLQVLLFVVLDLAIEAGATSKSPANVGTAMGVVFAFPMLVYGLASALVIAGAYVYDTYNGHFLIRNFALRSIDPVVVEWMFFSCFLGFPIFAMCLSLLSGTDDWWSITLFIWLCFIFMFFVLFCVNVLWYEVQACFEVCKNRYNDDNDSLFHVLFRCIMLRQTSSYAGRKEVRYLAYGSIVNLEYTDRINSQKNMVDSTTRESISLYSRLTMNPKLGKFFDNLGERNEERIYTIEDARDVRPFMTSETWSLEKMFCRKRSSRYIAIVKGPGALTEAQIRSSIICTAVGSCLVVFSFFSLLMYLGLGFVFSTFIVVIALIIFFPSFKASYRLYKFGFDINLARDKVEQESESAVTDLNEVSEAVYLVNEVYRITKPTTWFCWVMFGLELFFFFVYPLASLCAISNYPLAAIFFVVAGVTLCRYYVNAVLVLEETGHMDVVDGADEYQKWRNQSRLNEIVGNITRGRSRGVWMAVLGSIAFVFLALALGAVTNDVDQLATFDIPYTYSTDYYYESTDSTRYPSCRITSDLGESPLTSMADFAFLAGLAYRGRGDVTQRELDGWFQNFPAVDQDQTVVTWREEVDNTDSAVSFKLVTFPNSGNYAYVLIRGTTNNWDMLTDAQLWSAAAFMQSLRELLPIGAFWTPVMDTLIYLITKMESESINRVSFYRDTTAFVKKLQADADDGIYAGVGVTGHSLGGGLTLITAAQTGALGVGLSAPNAMLSRRSFDPPVSAEDLNSKTFNIIPERDLVPMIDDTAQNTQLIRCETSLTDVVGCHDSTRSLCEILYSCGSGPEGDRRPVLCECVTEPFRYPDPKPVDPSNSMSFSEYCASFKSA